MHKSRFACPEKVMHKVNLSLQNEDEHLCPKAFIFGTTFDGAVFHFGIPKVIQ